MESLDENEELDDPISLMQDNVEVCTGFNGNEDNFIHIVDSDSDTEAEEVDKEYSSCRNKTFTLPVTFFDIQRNIRLLNKCRPLSIKIVDCDKYPSYYKKSTLRSSATEIIESPVNVCADIVTVSPVIKSEKDENILEIDSNNYMCVVDKNRERAFQRTENINDIQQDQTENIFYETDYIISKGSYIPERKDDRIDVEKVGASKKNVIQTNFKDDNDLIDFKVKSREIADDIVSDNEIKRRSYIKSKQKENNEDFGIDIYMRLVEKTLKNFGADFDTDIKKDDKKYKNNNSILKINLKKSKHMDGKSIQSQINTSQKGRDNCREEKDYICSNTLRKDIGRSLKNNNSLKSCSSNEENNQIESKITNYSSKDNILNKFSIQENLIKRNCSGSSLIPCFIIQNKTETSTFKTNATIQNLTGNSCVKPPPVKKVQDNLQSSIPRMSNKHELIASKDVSYQNSVTPNDHNSTYQVYSLNSNVNNCCNAARTNSFVTNGNSTRLIHQHDINKLQYGRTIQTFISNRPENLGNKSLSVLRTVRSFGENMSDRNCRLPNSFINYNYYYPNNLRHSASCNCMNSENYVWSNLYPENYFYNSLSTLPQPPPSQTASSVQHFGTVSSNIKKLPQQQTRNLINVQDINNVRNIEVGAERIEYGDRIINNRDALSNINAIQSVLGMSSSSSPNCSTRKRMPSDIIGPTPEKRKILPHSSKNEQDSNTNLIYIKKLNNGYSPAVLPIFPHEKTLEMLAKDYKMQTMSTRSYNIKETFVKNKEYVHSNNDAIKRKRFGD